MTCQVCQSEEATYYYKFNKEQKIMICEKCKEILYDEHMYEHSIGKYYLEPIPKPYVKERK